MEFNNSPNAESQDNLKISKLITKIACEKSIVDKIEINLNNRIVVEHKVRKLKRAGSLCPFEENGICSNINIRCGERQQFKIPEAEQRFKNLAHKCNYKSKVKFADFKILIVDDEPLIRELCHDFFEALGINEKNIDLAEDAKDAENILNEGKLRNKNYCLILSDIKMKNTTGYELVNHLVERNYNARILLMSGFVEKKDFPNNYLGNSEIISGKKVVNEFMKKPINFSDFTKCVDFIKREFE